MKRVLALIFACALVAGGILLAPTATSSSGPQGFKVKGWKNSLPLQPIIRSDRPAVSRPAARLAGRTVPTDAHGRRQLYGNMTDRHATTQGGAAPAPLVNFEGLSQKVGRATPPDTTGEVGPNHFVQGVNFGNFAVYDKTGKQLAQPVEIGDLWPAGDECNTLGSGDPIIQYDQFANRWLISQFAFPRSAAGQPAAPFFECIAISTSGDPLGKYNAYTFLIDNELFPDYPHFGVWNDGYYMSVHLFEPTTGAYTAQGIIAFDRERMLVGDTAREIQYFVNEDYGGMLPADAQGKTPPPSNAPNYMVVIQDFRSGADKIHLYGFYADWDNPEQSFIGGPTRINIGTIDTNLCAGSRDCIPQQGGSVELDASARGVIMYPLVYRNFQTYHTLAFNHTVDVDGFDRAGISWYEVRNPGPNASLFQQGILSGTGDQRHRWIGSLSMDAAGNIALGYSISGNDLNPSLAYQARLTSDPLGVMGLGETMLIQGGGAQNGTNRWGDYASMSMDPADDCTFWFTGEYYPQTSTFEWHTRIFSMKLPACEPVTGPGPTPSPRGSTTAPPPPTPTPTSTDGGVSDTDAPSIFAVRDKPDPFSPNGDGRRDAAKIFFSIDENAHVTVDIHKPTGEYLGTLASDPLEAGDWFLGWNGVGPTGKVVKNGNYTYIIRATDDLGNTGEAGGTVKLKR